MVADSFKIAEGMQVFGHVFVLHGVQLVGVDADQVCTDLILIFVHLFLAPFHPAEALLAVMGQQVQRGEEVGLGGVGHVAHGQAALLDSQGRMGQEALIQPVERGVYAPFLLADPDDLFHKGQQQPVEGQENGHAEGAEHGVDQRNTHRTHDQAGQPKINKGGNAVIQGGADRHSSDLDDQIQKGRTPALGLGAQGRQQHRHRSADGDTQNQGIGGGKGDGSRHGQGLQNTHGGRGALQHGGKGHAHNDAQNRVGKGGEQADKFRALSQGGDGAAHALHAEHQHREAQKDVPHMPMQLFFGKHAQNDADHRHNGGQGGGGEKRDPAAALHAGKADDPAGDTGADQGALDHGHGLLHFHHAGGDKANHHNGSGR